MSDTLANLSLALILLNTFSLESQEIFYTPISIFMKILFFSLMLSVLTLSATGQELWKNETDDFTGKTKKATESYKVGIGVSNLYFMFCRVGETYFFYANSDSDLGCSGATGNYIILKFTDGTTLKLDDIADVDCKGKTKSTFVFKPADLEGKEIEKIRFKQSKFFDDYTWQSKFFLVDYLNAIK
jgi:hypothetical protein